MAHITGGGITDNLPRVLPRGTDAVIRPGSWDVPAIFQWLERAGGVPREDMLRTFNMGIGLILVVAPADADRVLAALRLSPAASVFDATEVLAARLRGLDGVADASVIRRPPASLKVIVREVEPVALVANARGALGVVGADARMLPFDRTNLDLPIVRDSDGAVVSVLARVQAFDPALFQAIDAARRTEPRRGQSDVILELGPHRVLLSRDAGPEVIQAVMLVAKDLAARSRSYAELDGRFAGQVVVRRRSSRSA
jgi:cell division septal protein FtsQ